MACVCHVEREVLLLRVEHQRHLVATLHQTYHLLVLRLGIHRVAHHVLALLVERRLQFGAQHRQCRIKVFLLEHRTGTQRHAQHNPKTCHALQESYSHNISLYVLFIFQLCLCVQKYVFFLKTHNSQFKIRVALTPLPVRHNVFSFLFLDLVNTLCVFLFVLCSRSRLQRYCSAQAMSIISQYFFKKTISFCFSVAQLRPDI